MLVHPVPHLVLQGAVLALSLLADDDEVQVVVASVVARQAVHMNHVSKQVQFTPGEIKMSLFYDMFYFMKDLINIIIFKYLSFIS